MEEPARSLDAPRPIAATAARGRRRTTRSDRVPSDGEGPQRGTTLIEAMVVIAVLGILLAGAVPSAARLVSTHRAVAATDDFVHALSLARGEAMKRGRRVYLAPTGATWHDGWAVFVDRNDNRLFDATVDEVIVRHAALPASITIANPSNPARQPFTDVGSPQRTYVLFDGAGYPRQRNGGLNVGSLVVRDQTGSATTVRTVCLAAYGRVRVVADRAGCG